MPSTPLQHRRFRIDLAYDGRSFFGWQSQVEGNTVQDVLLIVLQGICPAIRTVQGSGRTDAGVSASGQVAHFDVPMDWRMNGGEWQRAINSHLPPTIRVMRCGEVNLEFHARFSAIEKEYRYDIATGQVLLPLLSGLVWHRRGLNTLSALEEAISVYVGQHDFRAFSAKRRDGKDEERNTVRTLTVATVEPAGDELLRFRFRGNGFLYKMVRFLVGSAVHCAVGKITSEEMKVLLTGCDLDKKAPFCAPPNGLSLEKVIYPAAFEIV
tara:strand:- start:661 stop:1461 length:801 start_codon:yes stop_codon:yes gene_type:complete